MLLVRTEKWLREFDWEVVPRLAEAVQATAQARLHQSGYAELRRVRCEFCQGVLALRGCVSCYYLKQVAQSLVGRLEAVEQVNNQLEVASSAEEPPA